MGEPVTYDPELTEDECLRIGSALTTSLEYSPLGRGELVVRVTTDPRVGAPAWYHHFEHTVNIDHAILDIRGDREILLGAVLHELGHANYTTYLMPKGTKGAVASVATWMEEMRVEKRVHDVLRDPDDLRAMFHWLLESIKADTPTNQFGLSGLWLLTVGRYFTGICLWNEVDAIDTIVRSELGDRTVDQMKEILSESIEVEIDPGEPQPILELAEEWVELFPDAEPEEIVVIVTCGHGPPSGGGSGEEGEEEGEEGSGGGSGDDEEEPDGEDEGSGSGGGGDEEEDGETAPSSPTPEAAKGGGDPEGEGTEGGSKDELSSQENPGVLDPDDDAPPGGLISEETAEMLKKAIDDLGELTEEYERPEGPPQLSDPVKAMQEVVRAEKSRSRANYKDEPPPPHVRARAVSLARTLENLHLPAVAKSRVSTMAPPGRLHSREMVRRAADRSMGRMTAATPWKSTKRIRTSHKPIRVGCMTDTSGSMHWAETLVAEFAWTVATAGRKIGARTAAVTYGDRVSPVVLPETTPHTMKVYKANGGHEQFDVAAASLEGLLKLSHNDGSTKVLFNFSDGHYVIHDEPERARMWMQQWTRAGVLVFWIGCTDRYVRKIYDMPGVTFVEMPDNKRLIIPRLEEVLTRI